MKHINFGARQIDLDRLAAIMRRCPDIDNPTAAIREAIKQMDNSTYLEAEARKQARKAGKK